MLLSATTVIKARSGDANVWFPCDVKAESIEDVFALLIRDGAILADRLDTRISGGHREIIGRSPVIIGLGGIVLLQPLHIELRESA